MRQLLFCDTSNKLLDCVHSTPGVNQNTVFNVIHTFIWVSCCALNGVARTGIQAPDCLKIQDSWINSQFVNVICARYKARTNREAASLTCLHLPQPRLRPRPHPPLHLPLHHFFRSPRMHLQPLCHRHRPHRLGCRAYASQQQRIH